MAKKSKIPVLSSVQWKKIPKHNKHIIKGKKYRIAFKENIGTYLQPVEVIDKYKYVKENGKKYKYTFKGMKVRTKNNPIFKKYLKSTPNLKYKLYKVDKEYLVYYRKK